MLSFVVLCILFFLCWLLHSVMLCLCFVVLGVLFIIKLGVMFCCVGCVMLCCVLCPSTTISLHFFTQLSFSIISTCPNQLCLPLCMQFLMLTNPRRSLNSSEDFQPFSVTLHVHQTIIIPFLPCIG